MAKRTVTPYPRRERDFYKTPMSAVLPLLPHLPPGCKFIEPCYGEGDLARHLEAHGHQCVGFGDVFQPDDSAPIDARTHQYALKDLGAEGFVTNPPFSRELFHPILENLSNQAPTWLLIDAGWLHTRGAVPFLPRIRKIVAVGRVKWFPESKHEGKDDVCWVGASYPLRDSPPQFYGRPPK